MTDRYDDLRAAAEAASNGNLDTAERVMVGEIQCPLCGDGVIDHKTWTNIDDKPVGIEVFGLGEALTNYEAFVRLANPETIKALLAERDSLLAAKEADGRQKRAYLDEIDRLKDTVEGLTCDLRLAVETAYHRGATDWTRLNYPRIYAALTTKEG